LPHQRVDGQERPHLRVDREGRPHLDAAGQGSPCLAAAMRRMPLNGTGILACLHLQSFGTSWKKMGSNFDGSWS
jgi:hypothetical protein